jgi:hypothetical protein
MTLDASGNLGIGDTSPATGGFTRTLSLNSQTGNYGVFKLISTAGSNIKWLSSANGYQIGEIAVDSSAGSNPFMAFRATVSGSSTVESMRIDSSGNLLVGTTSVFNASRATFTSNANNTVAAVQGTAGGYCFISSALTNGGVFYHASFTENGTQRGSITSNGTSTTYATSSDYRLKENIAPMTGALSVVGQLKPCIYTWKSTGEASQGFIAHELQAVVPECVTGEKDAVDAEGNPQYQGIDTSFLVATLTASIQELKAIVDAQEARIALLESK